ncbi:MAG: YigZ family protein [Clostridiales bacterium]|nr:YigZ family protein [Clostridiales bacterium]
MKYLTIKSPSSDSFIERRSEFIGYISPATTEDEAIAFINSIREQHRKATHNVYAYLLREGNTTRYSDDGEPQGTAGVPVLDILQKEGLIDVCCVVTRYFGGIMLGGGGLVRAYSHAAKIAVDSAQKMHMCYCALLQIDVDYSLYGKVQYALSDFVVKVVDSTFGSAVKIDLLVDLEQEDPFTEHITNITNGQASIVKLEEKYADIL